MIVIGIGLIIANLIVCNIRERQGKLTKRFYVVFPTSMFALFFIVSAIVYGVGTKELILYAIILISGAIGLLFGTLIFGYQFIQPRDLKVPARVNLQKERMNAARSDAFVRRVESKRFPIMRKSSKIEYLKKAIKYSPANHRAHYLLARVYRETGDQASADREIKEAIRLSPNLAEYLEFQNDLSQDDSC